MSTTTRTTRTGRVVIESDGCSDYYGGALVQGAAICRISAPADVAARYTDADGAVDLKRLLRDLRGDRDWHGLTETRVLELRYVQ
jgi:hypothetical protein